MFNFEASVVKLFLMFLEAVAKPNYDGGKRWQQIDSSLLSVMRSASQALQVLGLN